MPPACICESPSSGQPDAGREKLAGWERTYGRAPTADDLIIPTRNHTGRQSPESQSALLGDLALLGLRRRRGHDLRRTFITLAQVDSARRDLLETITHGPRGDIINIYTSFPWPALCAEFAKLKIELREGKVLDGDFRGLATFLATVQRTARKRWQKSATPAGFETEVNPNRFADLQNRNKGLRVLLGSGEFAWKPQKAVRLGPNWARTRWAD